jgi:hypothetical protein
MDSTIQTLTVKPFNKDYSEPNEAYWEHVDAVLNLALALDINIALLPTWGDKLFLDSWGTGPVIFNLETAYQFGK